VLSARRGQHRLWQAIAPPPTDSMPPRPTCPLCHKRRPERFCPAAGEKICAVCCGTERERTLDCPADCTYLLSAHRYEREHRPPPAPGDLPFPDAEIPRHTIYEQQQLASGLAQTLLKFADEQRALADPDALAALMALGETYRTLVSGIYYEKPPEVPIQAALYVALAAFIQEYKKQAAATAFSGPKDSAVFAVLAYLARICRTSTNGRPRSRLFLQLLRAGSPAQEQPAEASRIILP
jgi:hypothetical protein